MTTEYLIVIPIDEIPVRASFAKGVPIPLHCTLMPWFRLRQCGGNVSAGMLSNHIERVAHSMRIRDMLLVSGRQELFGQNRDTRVYVVERNEALEVAHTRLLIAIAPSISSIQFSWVGAGYRPHVSGVGERTFPTGSTFMPRHISLVVRGDDRTKFVYSTHRIKYAGR